eukprot:SAG31_NODE_4554_length_3143_cov_24.683640_1_plen_60_part_00
MVYTIRLFRSPSRSWEGLVLTAHAQHSQPESFYKDRESKVETSNNFDIYFRQDPSFVQP